MLSDKERNEMITSLTEAMGNRAFVPDSIKVKSILDATSKVVTELLDSDHKKALYKEDECLYLAMKFEFTPRKEDGMVVGVATETTTSLIVKTPTKIADAGMELIRGMVKEANEHQAKTSDSPLLDELKKAHEALDSLNEELDNNKEGE